jgi:serine/threonine-protein kinase
LPKGVEQLVFQLLEKAPEDRPFLATDVVDKLEPFHVAAPSATRTSVPRASATSSSATTPHDKPSAGRSVPATIPESAREAKSVGNEPSSRPKTISDDAGSNDAPARAQRNDTIALVDKVGETREIPTKVAIGIIVGLSLTAGLAAYYMRTMQEPDLTNGATPSAKTSGALQQPLQKTRNDR